MTPFRTLIADDHPAFRRGLSLLIRNHFDDVVVTEASSFDEAMEVLSSEASIALVLVDLQMPGMSGGDSVAAIRAAFPECRVAVVTGNEMPQMALEVLGSGACGFIPKSLPESETLRAIGAVKAGQTYVPMRFADKMDGAAASSRDREGQAVEKSLDPSAMNLSPRQRDVLSELGQGKSNKEIARALILSEGTVKVHLAAIFRALGARNRTEAVLAAGKIARPD